MEAPPLSHLLLWRSGHGCRGTKVTEHRVHKFIHGGNIRQVAANTASRRNDSMGVVLRAWRGSCSLSSSPKLEWYSVCGLFAYMKVGGAILGASLDLQQKQDADPRVFVSSVALEGGTAASRKLCTSRRLFRVCRPTWRSHRLPELLLSVELGGLLLPLGTLHQRLILAVVVVFVIFIPLPPLPGSVRFSAFVRH